MRYTFGTGDPAAERLESIAAVFNPRALKFIQNYLEKKCTTVMDLGCGPGYTTEMLAAASGSQEVYGLDMAEHFLAVAKERCPGYHFIRHNVTRGPYPVKADVIYARFLLAHISNAQEVVNFWLEQLKPGGMLFIEEAERVDTTVPEFREYLDANEGLIKTQAASLFVGKELGRFKYNARILCNESVSLEVTNCRAASWFYPNTITVWENEDYIKNLISGKRRQQISACIKKFIDENDESGNITWRMRRIALKKE